MSNIVIYLPNEPLGKQGGAEFALPSAFRKTWLEGLKQMEDF